MPFIANTPESLIGRSDSKNPSTTCRGITSGGRPCRRPLATTASPTPIPARSRLGKLRVDDPSDESLYCWQHKDQASLSARSSPGPRTSNTPILEERLSLDTLADRLGLLDVKPSKKPRPSEGRNGQASAAGSRPPMMSRPKPKKEVSFCFCFRVPIEEVPPPPRPRPRPVQPTTTSPSGTKQSSQYLAPTSSRPRPSLSGGSHNSKHSSTPSTASQTAKYLSLIPPGASPQTASQLMAELAKPISQQDDPGYIYMFWLTPDSEPAKPPADAARSLLAPPSTPVRPKAGQRRPSDILDAFSIGTNSRGVGSGGEKKMLLKIGRATNVQRRLNEWTRQCGYDLSLIRYYPYISSSSPGPVIVPRKLPHSHKVERLIHIELAGIGLRVSDKEKCAACGRDHREWFSVDASRKGIMEVDDIIRRWVDWDEGKL